jgi:hypothetical protein
MSINDLDTNGHSLGFSPTLDNTKSMRYNSKYAAVTVTASSGNGLSNNRPVAGVSDNQTSGTGVQNTGVGNDTLQYKIGKYSDTSSNVNGILGTNNVLQVDNLMLEFRPYCEVKNGYITW